MGADSPLRVVDAQSAEDDVSIDCLLVGGFSAHQQRSDGRQASPLQDPTPRTSPMTTPCDPDMQFGDAFFSP